MRILRSFVVVYLIFVDHHRGRFDAITDRGVEVYSVLTSRYLNECLAAVGKISRYQLADRLPAKSAKN